MSNKKFVRTIVNQKLLPSYFPTHALESGFWEYLGRTVATFGFLEEVLVKAIFSFTATREYPEDEIEDAYSKWRPKLEKSLSDQLGGLIDTYGKAVRDNSSSTIENLNDLLSDLREASKIRNVLCHGSWRTPDKKGASVPFFVNRKKEVFESPIDITFLKKVQNHAVELICAVINTVVHMGWQFPSTSGSGQAIWR
ncbi:MAG: hypothetical protein OFPII_06660 [Osedax symbiont Rs1]|nr:MAG: hypothetical protein OFPII_06660 [Osedax symbiont Rs1]